MCGSQWRVVAASNRENNGKKSEKMQAFMTTAPLGVSEPREGAALS